MAQGLGELMERWRADPRPSATIQVSQAIADGCVLTGPTDEDRQLALEIGRVAVSRYPDDVSVLLAVGRMYLAVGELAEAQTVAVQAAKQQASDPRAYKLLGEMLLRRGDARRATKAFERALEGGIVDAHTKLWFENARTLMALQDQRGAGAVASEVVRLLPSLTQPPLPLERVSLPVSAPTPWHKQTLQGTGIPSEAKRRRVRQQTLLGMPAASPRDTLPSDELDDAAPTALLEAGKPKPKPIPRTDDSADDLAKTVVRAMDGPARVGRAAPLDAVKGGPVEPMLQALLRGGSGTDHDELARTVVKRAPPALASSAAAPEDDPLAMTLVKPEAAVSLPAKGTMTEASQPGPRPSKVEKQRSLGLPDMSEDDEGTRITEMREKLAAAAAAAAERAAAEAAAASEAGTGSSSGNASSDPQRDSEPPTAVLSAAALAAAAAMRGVPSSPPPPRGPSSRPPGMPPPPSSRPPPRSAPRPSAPRPTVITRPEVRSIVSITSEAEIIEDTTNDAETEVIRPGVGRGSVADHSRRVADRSSRSSHADRSSRSSHADRSSRSSQADRSSRSSEVELEEIDTDDVSEPFEPARGFPPRGYPTRPISAPPPRHFGSPAPASSWRPPPGGLVSLTADVDTADEPLREDPLRSFAPTRSLGPRMSASELVDEFDYRPPPPAARPIPAVAAGFISTPPPAAVAPTPSAPPPSLQPRTRSKRRVVWALVALLLTSGAASAGYVEWERRRAEDAREAKSLVVQAEAALRRGDTRALGEADALLTRARDLDSRDSAGALTRVRREVLRVLDQGAPAKALEASMAEAKALGVPEADLAFAAIAAAAVAKDARTADERMERWDKQAARATDAFYQLATAAALEIRGDARAVVRYEAATRADPKLASAGLRLARAAILLGDPKQVDARVKAFVDSAPGRPEGVVLVALADEIAGKHPKAPVTVGSVADLPRPLRAVGWMLSVDPERAAQGFAAAIDDADTVSVALFCARFAQRLGDAASAVQAVDRALVLAPDHAPSRAFRARLALLGGKLDEARDREGGLEPRDAAQVRGILAYEDGDLSKLTASLGGLADSAAADAAVLAAARDRLRGAKPFAKDRYVALADGPLWADIVAVDAALDAGELKRAREIVDRWTDAATHPVRSVRLARLLRYEDKLDDARKAIGAAAPTHTALVERALLDAEKKEERAKALSSLDPKLEPERGWLEIYLRARTGVAGVVAGRKPLRKLKDPGEEAPLSLRVAAALAAGEIQDRARGDALVRPMLKAWSQNLDVMRAAISLGLMPPDAIKRRRRQ